MVEYFTYPSVFEQLASSVKKHDLETFVSAGNSLDMTCVGTLRGLSYMAWVLSNMSIDDRSETQHDTAVQTIAELTAFVARMLEFQNEAACLEFALEKAQHAT